jgi:HK97 family phage prohead protease
MRDQLINLKDVSDRFIAAPVEVKLVPSFDTGEISGYGAVFGNIDNHGDVIEPGAFAKSLADHLAGRTRPVMLWNHNPDRPIGAWESFVEDATGLKLSGRINTDVQAGREALSLIKQGAVAGLSIGYRVMPGGAQLDGRTGVRRLKSVALHEVSITPFPSNRLATITEAKSFGSARDFEHFLRESGVSRAAATKLAAGGWPALSTNDNAAAMDLAAAVKSAILELKGSSK